jgi:uncharacterized membrane protein YsdA (DUF1294 family)
MISMSMIVVLMTLLAVVEIVVVIVAIAEEVAFRRSNAVVEHFVLVLVVLVGSLPPW